jgi:hypothetical protein
VRESSRTKREKNAGPRRRPLQKRRERKTPDPLAENRGWGVRDRTRSPGMVIKGAGNESQRYVVLNAGMEEGFLGFGTAKSPPRRSK